MERQTSSGFDSGSKINEMDGCLYYGWVRHRRFKPIKHDFTYRVFMYFVDIDTPQKYFSLPLIHSTKLSLYWYREQDYLNKTRIKEIIFNHFNTEFDGKVYLLTYIRTFGFGFNPVNFYYCYENSQLKYIVSEITNTPWLEKHAYAFQVTDNQKMLYEFNKEFHVSPFLPMEMRYQWFFTQPLEKLHIQMNNFKDGEKYFDATLNLTSKPITKRTLIKSHLTYPLLPLMVKVRIYWNALLLKLKGAKFYTHPSKIKVDK